ncbi:MAG: molecular chaperone DnaJ [Hyphomicrobiales bacterium]|nr:MAG: molecular chaperone DnaJ [Hyphomicrobiales bacterium]
MSKRDFYEVLGVDKSADEKALKSAYRKKAMQFHPDRNPDDEAAAEKFRESSEAYEILKDAQKRSAYDQYGHAAFEQGGMGGGQGGGFGGFGGGGMSDIFEDIFGDFMGGGRPRRNAPERGSDLRYNMEILLQDAFDGKQVEIEVPVAATCADCNGSGAEAGTEPETCTTCAGHGKVRVQQGFFTIERACHACSGRGEIIKTPCGSCRGEGKIDDIRNLDVSIPAGVEDGTRIRLTGEGEGGTKGGPNGDLYIFISVATHEFYQREGSNLYCRVPITFTEATLGGEMEIPTLDGTTAKVKIPSGTQTGKQFRLKGKGMPVLRTKNAGDLYILVSVETPQNLNKRQRELLREFAEISEDNAKNTNPESFGFFARMKDMLGKG